MAHKLWVITWKASQDIYYKQYGSFSRDAERIEYFLRMVRGPVLVKLPNPRYCISWTF